MLLGRAGHEWRGAGAQGSECDGRDGPSRAGALHGLYVGGDGQVMLRL